MSEKKRTRKETISEVAKSYKAQGEAVYHSYRSRKSEVLKYKKILDKPENKEKNKLKEQYNQLVDKYYVIKKQRVEKKAQYLYYKMRNDEIQEQLNKIKEQYGGLCWKCQHNKDWKQLQFERKPITLTMYKYYNDLIRINTKYKELLDTLFDLKQQIIKIS